MTTETFIEIDCHQVGKHGRKALGDLVISRRLKEENRVLAVLADGLGSGIKASVLATLTGTMAIRCIAGRLDIRRTAELIMDILPVCSRRKIAYSTFTIADINTATATAALIEYENPGFILLRGDRIETPASERVAIGKQMIKGRGNDLLYTQTPLQPADRIILLSDGVSQAGLGNSPGRNGWGREQAAGFALEEIRKNSDISARHLARKIVDRALYHDQFKARDDLTAAVVYVRRPRHLLLVTGPPMTNDKDPEMARRTASFQGRKIICGGSTANLISRELQRPLRTDPDPARPALPPASSMPGIDLVSEGALTMATVAELLEPDNRSLPPDKADTAVRIVNLMMDSDIIHFLVGTRINQAHQEPTIPVEMDIRRNVVRRIRRLLEEKHLKETRLTLL